MKELLEELRDKVTGLSTDKTLSHIEKVCYHKVLSMINESMLGLKELDYKLPTSCGVRFDMLESLIRDMNNGDTNE